MSPPASLRTAAEVEGTIVFTDLVGFTEFTATRGDEEALQLLAVQGRVVGEELPATARLVKEIGDGLFLWFPEPLAALHCSLALHRRLETESAATGLPLWIRVGMHHGRALRRGDDLVGNDVNIAARIVDLAAPGEILVSETVRCAVGGAPDVLFEELGPVVMKGLPEPVRLWRATAAPAVVRSPRPRAAGRPARRAASGPAPEPR